VEDRQIVDMYWARSEDAIAETEKKYGRYCHYIAYQILFNDEDVEEVLNDTYLKVWNSIPPNRPRLLKPYVGMICRQLALDLYKTVHAEKRGGRVAAVFDEMDECVLSVQGDDIEDTAALSDILERFIRALPERTRRIFIRRYFYMSSVPEIAADFRMKESAVAMLLLRTRNKLKKLLEKEWYLL